MSNIVDIKNFATKKPELVWECSCGGQHFYLNLDGAIECRSCKLIRESLEWVYRPGCEPKC